MRRIKFRGMSVSGEWSYGNLSVSQQKKEVCSVDAGAYVLNSIGLPYAYKVLPETVGQFTGLYDKSNTEIYEGDIIAKFDFVNPYFRSVVVCLLGAFGYIPYDSDFIAFAQNYHLGWVNNKSEKIKVIGNIYENPELVGPDSK